MRSSHLFIATLLVAVFAAVAAPKAAPAASGGWGWDSVTKFQMGTDQSSLSPGSFDDDFATASSPQPEQSAPSGGIFGRMQQAMNIAKSMGAMMSNGIAERHYLAGTKERTDQLAQMTATIVDCSARTITRLDLRKKTYRVTSMDEGGTGGSSETGGPSPRATDDGTRVAVTVNNTALGARNVNGQPTNGYRSNMTITETKPSGDSHTQHADMTAYYSSQNNPVLDCYRGTGGVTTGGGMMMSGYARLMRALSASGQSSRYSIKQSGPAMPLGHMAMWAAVQFTGDNGANGNNKVTVVTERAHLHPISADDPIFGIPAGFTEEK